MSETCKNNSWLNSVLLLGALSAGIFTTQFVPAYQERAGKVTYPSRAAAKPEAGDKSQGYSKTETRDPHITLVNHVE